MELLPESPHDYMCLYRPTHLDPPSPPKSKGQVKLVQRKGAVHRSCWKDTSGVAALIFLGKASTWGNDS